jgi:hypothetical protein
MLDTHFSASKPLHFCLVDDLARPSYGSGAKTLRQYMVTYSGVIFLPRWISTKLVTSAVDLTAGPVGKTLPTC